jgi:BASS family bile acid:Na+ symporter
VTIFYIPIVLPLMLPGVEVNPWDLASSLIVTMLIPLALGLVMKSHSPEAAGHWQPVLNKISGLAIMIMLVVGLGLNVSNIISLIGTGGFLALLIFIFGSLMIGMVLGGRNPAERSVMGLGTAQRNLAAAIVIATQNFTEGNTLAFILVASILSLLILLPTSKRLGARSQAVTAPPAAATE